MQKKKTRKKEKILRFLRQYFTAILIAIAFFAPQQRLWAQQAIDDVGLNPYPVDPEELDLLGQLKIFIDQVNNQTDELIFYSFASALPLISSISSYGPNEIGLIAPNPHFRLSLISGLQFVMPIVNFDLLKASAGSIEAIKESFIANMGAERNEEDASQAPSTNVNMGPMQFISNQSSKHAISLPTAMVFFSIRFQLTLGIEVLDKMQFGLTYITPKIPTKIITDAIGQNIGFPYKTDTTLYGIHLRYKILDDPIALVYLGGAFNHVKFSFEAEMLSDQESEWNEFEHARTRRAQRVYSDGSFNLDEQFPNLGPYEILINYQTKADYYMSSLDFFMRADFGIPLFRPFVDFGLTLKLSEILKHSSGYFIFIREPTSLDPLNDMPAGRYVDLDASVSDKNILLRDYHPYNYRKSGISILTPRISVGFNALYIINFHASISFLRAESPVPALSLALFINLDF